MESRDSSGLPKKQKESSERLGHKIPQTCKKDVSTTISWNKRRMKFQTLRHWFPGTRKSIGNEKSLDSPARLMLAIPSVSTARMVSMTQSLNLGSFHIGCWCCHETSSCWSELLSFPFLCAVGQSPGLITFVSTDDWRRFHGKESSPLEAICELG